MTVMADIGEKAFIQKVLSRLKPDPRLIGGFGHDSGVIYDDQLNSRLMFKIDRAAAPVALKYGWASEEAWGRLAVTANCSDILASGGEPIAFMLSLTLPSDYSVRSAERIIEGAAKECDVRGIVFAGGDTKEGQVPQIVGSAVGHCTTAGPLLRSSAEPGDRLYLAGPVGGFAAALGLMTEVDAHSELDNATRQDCIKYMAEPSARWDEARAVNTTTLVKGGMDASDGLYDVFVQLSRTHGFEFSLSNIQFHSLVKNSMELLDIELHHLLFGAGDWNIAYIVSSQNIDELNRIADDNSLILFEIGKFISESGIFINFNNNRRYKITAPINEHFRAKLEDGKSFYQHLKDAVKLGD